jgi:hypothetical protein
MALLGGCRSSGETANKAIDLQFYSAYQELRLVFAAIEIDRDSDSCPKVIAGAP